MRLAAGAAALALALRAKQSFRIPTVPLFITIKIIMVNTTLPADMGRTRIVTPSTLPSPSKKSGHKDFFLVRKKDGANSTIAVVLGKMLGGDSAGWQGTCDGEDHH